MGCVYWNTVCMYSFFNSLDLFIFHFIHPHGQIKILQTVNSIIHIYIIIRSRVLCTIYINILYIYFVCLHIFPFLLNIFYTFSQTPDVHLKPDPNATCMIL